MPRRSTNPYIPPPCTTHRECDWLYLQEELRWCDHCGQVQRPGDPDWPEQAEDDEADSLCLV